MTDPAGSAVPARLEELKPGVRVAGLLPEPVTVLAIASHGPDAVTVTFQGVDGGLGQRLLYRADEARLVVQPPESRWRFDADPVEFRLVAEALRIRMAGLHDPMVAVLDTRQVGLHPVGDVLLAFGVPSASAPIRLDGGGCGRAPTQKQIRHGGIDVPTLRIAQSTSSARRTAHTFT
jgi:hypothetical protein